MDEYIAPKVQPGEKQKVSSKEIIAVEVQIEPLAYMNKTLPSVITNELDAKLAQVNQALDGYTSNADTKDYAFAIAGGLLSGIIDAAFVKEFDITNGDIGVSHKKVNQFIQKYAKSRGFEDSRLNKTIENLEKAFPVAQDNVWKGKDIRVSAYNHHLADLAHHPTPLGLVAAIAVQLFRVGTFVNRDGEIHFLFVKTTAKDVLQTLAPAVITGILNWLVTVGEGVYEGTTDKEIPEYVHKLARITASAPIIIEIAKCADNWFGHLVSDMGGSKNTAGEGMGIPGILISLLYELSALPIFKDSGLPEFVNTLYQKQKIDLRHEIAIYEEIGKQSIPVLFNEIFVRLAFFLTHLVDEISLHKNFRDIDWNNVVPFKNRTIDRMITVSTMTFTIADTVDAAVHAAIESGGNWVLFAGRFATRFNYIGAGRAAIAVVKEVSNERKEAQLIHEKRLLSEEKAEQVLQQLQEYKDALEERVSEYLAEDIEAFLTGFDYMRRGVAVSDSDLVIKGNVVIQRVLGREPQFTDQKSFDELMDSDAPLLL